MSQAELIKQLTSKQLVFHLFITQIIILTIGLISSIFIYKDLQAFFDIFRPEVKFLFVGILFGLAVVGIDLILMKKVPAKYYDDGGINEKLFSKYASMENCLLGLGDS